MNLPSPSTKGTALVLSLISLIGTIAIVVDLCFAGRIEVGFFGFAVAISIALSAIGQVYGITSLLPGRNVDPGKLWNYLLILCYVVLTTLVVAIFSFFEYRITFYAILEVIQIPLLFFVSTLYKSVKSQQAARRRKPSSETTMSQVQINNQRSSSITLRPDEAV